MHSDHRMILVPFLILLLTLYYSVCITASHFVLLKNNQTLQNFIAYDTTYPISEQILFHIEETYKIGDSAIISGEFPEKFLKRLRRCPLVAEIAPEFTFQAYSLLIQYEAPRHLVSLSNKSGSKRKRESYFFDGDSNGEDVNVYVIDGGIEPKSAEFSDRIVAAVDFTMDGLGSNDVHGHGTHVSGIIASQTFGVAKDANLIVLKVLDKNGQGTLTLVVSALEFAVNHHRQSGALGVVNLSLGAPYSSLINRIVDAVSRSGLVVVVAAGNSEKNACQVLPASSKLAITVGAIDDRTDKIAQFSNWGPCVDIFASGVDVASVSTKRLKSQAKLRLQRKSLHVYLGTSMAAPIVSGVAANLLSSGILNSEVKDHLLSLAVNGRIPADEFAARLNTPNRVVYNGCDPIDYESDGWSSEDE